MIEPTDTSNLPTEEKPANEEVGRTKRREARSPEKPTVPPIDLEAK
jgi:hypothetical protein